MKLSTVTTQGMNLFKTIVSNAKKEDIVAAIQRAIERERAGETGESLCGRNARRQQPQPPPSTSLGAQIDKLMLHSAVQLFLVMGIAKADAKFKDVKDVIAAGCVLHFWR